MIRGYHATAGLKGPSNLGGEEKDTGLMYSGDYSWKHWILVHTLKEVEAVG